MSRVERFFHIRRGDSTDGGATVRVVGNTEQVGQVDVQVAFCHSITGKDQDGKPNGDPYCKRVGREKATAGPIKVIALRYLPAELARIGKLVDKRAHCLSNASCNDYTFAIKYFLPKE
jgi:hypothetical protein